MRIEFRDGARLRFHGLGIGIPGCSQKWHPRGQIQWISLARRYGPEHHNPEVAGGQALAHRDLPATRTGEVEAVSAPRLENGSQIVSLVNFTCLIYSIWAYKAGFVNHWDVFFACLHGSILTCA